MEESKVISYELISKKRKPLKGYAIGGFFLSIIIFGLAIYYENSFQFIIYKKIIISIALGLFGICIAFLSFSSNVKNVIGKIGFNTEFITIDLLGKVENIEIKNISEIRIDLAGYEGQNRSSLVEASIKLGTNYQKGLENYIQITENGKERLFEFYIPSKSAWININKISGYYYKRLELNG